MTEPDMTTTTSEAPTAMSAHPADGAPDVPVGPRRPLPGPMIYRLTILTAAIWVLFDQATKVLALQLPAGGVGQDPLRLRLVFNENAAFGIPGFPGMFIIITAVVLVLVVRALPRTDRLWLGFAYGLVSGGAVGNVIDRVVRPPGFPNGAVVDFIEVGVGALRWPTFNVADIGIVVGALLIAGLLFHADAEERRAAQRRVRHRSVRPKQTGPQG
jgi:signal peptidase II